MAGKELGVAQQGVDGGLSTQGAGWKVLFARSGNLSGWRIDSTDKSISKSGQNRWSVVGRRTLRICRIVAALNQGNSE